MSTVREDNIKLALINLLSALGVKTAQGRSLTWQLEQAALRAMSNFGRPDSLLMDSSMFKLFESMYKNKNK